MLICSIHYGLLLLFYSTFCLVQSMEFIEQPSTTDRGEHLVFGNNTSSGSGALPTVEYSNNCKLLNRYTNILFNAKTFPMNSKKYTVVTNLNFHKYSNIKCPRWGYQFYNLVYKNDVSM